LHIDIRGTTGKTMGNSLSKTNKKARHSRISEA